MSSQRHEFNSEVSTQVYDSLRTHTHTQLDEYIEWELEDEETLKYGQIIA